MTRLGAATTTRFLGLSNGGPMPMNRYDVIFQKGRMIILIALDAERKIDAFAYGTAR